MNINKIIGKIINSIGYELSPKDKDTFLEKEFEEIYEKCKDYSLVSKERLYATYQAVKYIIESNIEGDFVECGVWKGGTIMMMIYTLQLLKQIDRKIYLYDTFEGMSEPTKDDVDYRGRLAEEQLKNYEKNDEINLWCFTELEKVKKDILSLGYPEENIIFVKGKVEDTIPKTIPDKISLLRLDTDWYESTKHELKYLYPLLNFQGILIIDDYGFWKGSKKAVDEYFKNKKNILLFRTDFTGRIMIKLDRVKEE